MSKAKEPTENNLYYDLRKPIDRVSQKLLDFLPKCSEGS
jgi:hypothetical protein